MASGDSTGAWTALSEAVARAGGVDETARLLGLDAAEDSMDQQATRSMLHSLLSEAARGREARDRARSGGVGPGRPRAEDLRHMLCWKE
jgi:hypothetical protein